MHHSQINDEKSNSRTGEVKKIDEKKLRKLH